jgi:hypothetical protein
MPLARFLALAGRATLATIDDSLPSPFHFEKTGCDGKGFIFRCRYFLRDGSQGVFAANEVMVSHAGVRHEGHVTVFMIPDGVERFSEIRFHTATVSLYATA